MLAAAVGVVYRRPIGAVVTVQRVRRRLQMSRLDLTRVDSHCRRSWFYTTRYYRRHEEHYSQSSLVRRRTGTGYRQQTSFSVAALKFATLSLHLCVPVPLLIPSGLRRECGSRRPCSCTRPLMELRRHAWSTFSPLCSDQSSAGAGP